MKKFWFVLLLFMLYWSAATVTAADSKTMVFIPKSTNTTYWLFLRKGAADRAKELGYSLDYQGVATEADVMGQVNLFNNIAASRPAGILCAAIDAKAMQPAVKKAMDSGIPVVMVDAGIEDASIPVASITTDNLQGGVDAGELMAQLVGKKGKVANLGISAGSHTGIQRSAGFEEAIKKYPEMTALPVQWAEADPALAMNITTDLLNANPDIVGVYAAAAPMAAGAAQAVKAKGLEKKIKIVTFDPSPEILPLFEQGIVHGIIAQSPYQMGNTGIGIIESVLKGGQVNPDEKNVEIKAVVITADNYNDAETQKLLQTPDKF